MEKSESIKNLATALVKFNGLVGKVSKDSKNPFFKSKYAALPDILSAIHLPLQEAGLTLNQFPSGSHGLTTILIHADSGEYMMDTYEMKPTKDDPQGVGSCITYQRRYAVGAVLSLNIDEDDDGNEASKPVAKAPVQVKEPSTDDKVASMQGRLNPELPSGIAQSILNAKTQAELKAIWEANTDLHKVKKFTDAITQMKADLLKQGDK
jgi:hypothetical protein